MPALEIMPQCPSTKVQTQQHWYRSTGSEQDRLPRAQQQKGGVDDNTTEESKSLQSSSNSNFIRKMIDRALGKKTGKQQQQQRGKQVTSKAKATKTNDKKQSSNTSPARSTGTEEDTLREESFSGFIIHSMPPIQEEGNDDE